MKKLIFALLLIAPVSIYAQKSADVLGHHFAVGDTITLTEGTMPDGKFMSASLGGTHLAPGYANYKFIIEKIKVYTSGMNTTTDLMVKFRGLSIMIDASVAITKKEILLK
jgi:hypothetical protein